MIANEINNYNKKLQDCPVLPGNLWKGFESIIPAWGKKGFIPGGRPARPWARPGPPRNPPALCPARPKGLAKLSWAAAEEAGVRTGEVGRERGEVD